MLPANRRISGHFLANLVGSLAPVGVTLVTVPIVLRLVGPERFGVLSIVWLLVGYFGVLDLGLSRATANRLAQVEPGAPETTRVFVSAALSNLGLGLLAGLLAFFLAPWLLGQVVKVPEPFRSELPGVVLPMAALVPVLMIGGVFVGSLEARERFGLVNATQVAGGVISQLAAVLAALMISPSLEVVVPVIAVARTIPVVLQGVFAVQVLGIRSFERPDTVALGRLFRFGSWVSVTSIVGPVLVSADQFIIGAVLGAQAVAFYAVSFSLVTRLNLVPTALVRALYPRLSRANPAAAAGLEGRALLPLSFVMTGLLTATVLVLPAFLTMWVGETVAAASAGAGILLAFGVWLQGHAGLPLNRLQAQGRPDLPAKCHLAELVPYLVVLWELTRLFGLPGAALAWSLRLLVDAILLFGAAGYRPRQLVGLLPGLAILGTAGASAWAYPPDLMGAVARGIPAGAAWLVWIAVAQPNVLGLLRGLKPRRIQS